MNKKITTITTSVLLASILTIGSISFTSCDKENASTTSDSFTKKGQSSDIPEINTQSIAYDLINTLLDNPKIAETIHKGVLEVMSYGLDENLPLYDILNTENSVFFNENTFNEMKDIFNTDELKQNGLNEDNYYGDINIYWGYSKKWDGFTTPVVCFIDDFTTNKMAHGYKIEDGEIKLVTITEEEFDKAEFPIIVINKNDINYSKYPMFKEGIFFKNGIFWMKPKLKAYTPTDIETISEIDDDDTYVYEARTFSIKSGGIQHDSWVCGGSEFELHLTYGRGTSAFTTTQRFSFTRDEIDRKVTKPYNTTLISDWPSYYSHVGFLLIEDDTDWGTTTVHIDLGNDEWGHVQTDIEIGECDDELFNENYSRVTFFRRCEQNDNVFSMDDLDFTMGTLQYHR